MIEINNPPVTTYFIVRNGIIRHGVLGPNQYMKSGLDEVEEFTDIDEWAARLEELGVDISEVPELQPA